MTKPTYSFVIPVYNEEASLPGLYDRLSPVLGKLDGPAEVIFIDDGSTDSSYELLSRLQAQDHRLKIIRLSRNFGHQMAISAGLKHATGEATLILDADLQDPPETIFRMIARWKEGYEVVYGQRKERPTDTVFKKVSASLFYTFLSLISDIEIPRDTADFRLVDKKAVNAFCSLTERNRYVRGMFSWIGYKQVAVPYTRQTRIGGKSNYSIQMQLRLAEDAIFGFSYLPLRMIPYLGILLTLLSVSGAILCLICNGVFHYRIGTSIKITLIASFFSGIQVFVLGILAGYLRQIHQELKARPPYLVSETVGFQEDTKTKAA